ncbi:MAG: hypothetical protein ABJH08_05760 [Balneola sp.]
MNSFLVIHTFVWTKVSKTTGKHVDTHESYYYPFLAHDDFYSLILLIPMFPGIRFVACSGYFAFLKR